MRFRDRTDAGRQLGPAVEQYRAARPVVVGLVRGGVVVAAEVAGHLDVPLHLTVVCKLGHPAQPELGLGALAEDGVPSWNEPMSGEFALRARDRYRVLVRAREELRRRRAGYRRGRVADLTGRTVLVVDDGLATGGTAVAAAGFARRRGAERVVFAVPVAALDAVGRLRGVVDDVVSLVTPAGLFAVGAWYERFDQCSDQEIVQLLPED